MKTIKVAELNDDEAYPSQMSQSGTNAFYLEFCPAVGYRPNYASCLCRINEQKNNNAINSNFSDCATSIARLHCPALKMQEEEKEAGKALYYVNRTKLRQLQIEHAKLRGETLGLKLEPKLKATSKSVTPMPVKNNSADDKLEIQTPSYADAINRHIKQRKSNDGETKSASRSAKDDVNFKNEVSGDLVSKNTMSLLEIAKRKSQKIN